MLITFILQIFEKAFKILINASVTYSGILNRIKQAYDNALEVRNKRISQFITQDVSTVLKTQLFITSYCSRLRPRRIYN